jgi:hypothetical protein
MKKRDIYIYIGVFLLVVGLLPFAVSYKPFIRTIADVLIAVCGLIVLITR